MTILNTLQDEMKMAMKSHDQTRLDAIRLMISAIKYAQVDNPNMGDPEIIAVLSKEAKKRREAIVAYKAAGRDDQAKQEEYELNLIEGYLPKMMSEDEVRENVTSLKGQLTSEMNFGEIMKLAMKAVGGQSDGATVSKIVREIFSK